ncbi:MAG: hypothetical protein HC929_06420 [Leptolyngbyaceae cyanobacterium SM2_5_2]|nr:hypothetical protein [Leptolyngbyaceae cyanobacterium SM2_5_2]
MPLSNSAPDTSPQIYSTLTKLRSLSQTDIQAAWHGSPASSINHQPPWTQDWSTWPLVALNDRHHIAWPRGKTPLWLHQRLTWPASLQGYPLQGMSARLALRWWADQAEVYINGQLAHSGDIFDCWTRVELTGAVVPGEAVEVSLKLLSPGHDEGALVKSQLEFEAANVNYPEPAFVADELTVLATYLTAFAQSISLKWWMLWGG